MSRLRGVVRAGAPLAAPPHTPARGSDARGKRYVCSPDWTGRSPSSVRNRHNGVGSGEEALFLRAHKYQRGPRLRIAENT
eukprot:3447855-Prymnesium_polylepis.1